MMMLMYVGQVDLSGRYVVKITSSVRLNVSQASVIPLMPSMKSCAVSMTSLIVLVFVLLLSSSKTRLIVRAFRGYLVTGV
jgi:hypothetical protein